MEPKDGFITHQERVDFEAKWSKITVKIRSLYFTGFEQALDINTQRMQSSGNLNSGLQLRDALHRMHCDEQVASNLNEALTFIMHRVYFQNGEALRRVYISSIGILDDHAKKMEKSRARFDALYEKLR